MSYLEYNVKTTPSGWRKILFVHWSLVLVICAVASMGFLMLYSVAGGSFSPWAEPQIKRFGMGLVVMLIVAMVPIWFWRSISLVLYGVGLLLLIAVPLVGIEVNGSTRWIDLGLMRLQPSELMKILMVMFLASFYDWLPNTKTSRPLWVAIPVVMILLPSVLIFEQPDLGTTLLLMAGSAAVMFLAGVHWAYFASVAAILGVTVFAVFETRGTENQVLSDYHYGRIDVFLDPSSNPTGLGYQAMQGKIAMGSGGWAGKGFMQGTQSRLNFLPEKHTDFIFNTLAEEFGFIGSFSLLVLYSLIVMFCIVAGLRNRDRYSSLLCLGIGTTFFLYFALNIAMVTGLAPVVGVPLPLVSYGGSAMLVLMVGFGLVQSAHIHRPR